MKNLLRKRKVVRYGVAERYVLTNAIFCLRQSDMLLTGRDMSLTGRENSFPKGKKSRPTGRL